jgi:ribokinase
VLVIGSSNTDLVCRASRLPRPGETVRGSSFETFAGGKGANQAVAAARAGASVVFCGAVGDDGYGSARLADLATEDIDVSRVRVVAGGTSGVALIVVGQDGENQIVLVPGTNDRVDPAAAAAALQSTACSVLSLTLEIPFETVAHVLGASRPEAVVVLNAAPFDARVVACLPSIDVLVCNEIEAGDLLERAVSAETAGAAGADLLALGPRAAIITLGSRGAVLAGVDGVHHVPAPAVDVVDSTGAGDAFCGALAAWIAAGSPLADAVRAGVAAGSLAVTRDGAQPSLPRRAEIVELLSRMPAGG